MKKTKYLGPVVVGGGGGGFLSAKLMSMIFHLNHNEGGSSFFINS